MGSEDSEQLLEDARFKHLSETTLISYKNEQLDEMALALVDAHLKLCLVCERRLDFLKAEAEALESYEPTENDRAAVEELIRQQED
jgi:anti-sigma factor ChrR (cupin superfamily)